MYLGNDGQYHLTEKGFLKANETFKMNASKKRLKKKCKKHNIPKYWQDGKWYCIKCKKEDGFGKKNNGETEVGYLEK